MRYLVLSAFLALAALSCAHVEGQRVVADKPVVEEKLAERKGIAPDKQSGKNAVGHKPTDQTDKYRAKYAAKSCTAGEANQEGCPETAKIPEQAAKQEEAGCGPSEQNSDGCPGTRVDQAAAQAERGCNPSDVKQGINAGNHKFPNQMDNCASPSWGNAAKSATCLRKDYPGLSEPCIMCFAQMAHCSAQNCKMACMMNHKSDGCLKCAESNCRDLKGGTDFSLETCTGLTAMELPPRRG